jgi:hypothetical protein
MTIDEGDYQGEIGLDPAHPYTVVERHEAFQDQVDREAVLYGLPDNEVSRIPTSRDFEVRSAAAPGATQTKTLQVLTISYEVAGTDSLGLPNNYTALVTYRGQEEFLELHHYDVTANYAGELSSSVQRIALTGTYRPVAVVDEGAPIASEETAVISDTEVPLAGPQLPLFPLAIASATVVVVLAIPLLYFFLLTNARLLRLSEAGGQCKTNTSKTTRKAKAEVICRRRLVLNQGEAELRIPPWADIFDGATYCLLIKSRLACRAGSVAMTWQGKVVAVVPLDAHVHVNFRDMLIQSVDAILAETEELN